MGIWTYEAKVFDEKEVNFTLTKGLVIASSFVDAMKKLEKYFGEELMGIRVDWCICDEDNVMDLEFYDIEFEKLSRFINRKE